MTKLVPRRRTRSELFAVRRRLVYVLFSGAVLAWLASTPPSPWRPWQPVR